MIAQIHPLTDLPLEQMTASTAITKARTIMARKMRGVKQKNGESTATTVAASAKPFAGCAGT
jgi:hypothetical protein